MTDWTSPTTSRLQVFDIADPMHPLLDCTLDPAVSGRFLSATRIAFWTGNSLRLADIASGSVELTGTLPAVPSAAAFNADGSSFAYRVADDTGGLSVHLFRAGHDLTLITRPGIGGHGGPPYGPIYQLQFSSDGKYILSVDSLDAVFPSGPPNFLVYDQNGDTVFQSASAAFGTWAINGDRLYFLEPTQPHGITGDLHSWDPTAGQTTVARNLSSYFWPVQSPDGHRLLFNSYDAAGLPHLWGIDLSTGAIDKLSTSISEHPVFVGSSVVWSTEDQPCSCGPGGNSAPDGKVSVHDIQTGLETTIELPGYGATPGYGGDVTYFVVDVWL